MNIEQIIKEAFKNELATEVKAYGIKRTVEMYGYTGPFAYFPKDIDLVEFLEELFSE